MSDAKRGKDELLDAYLAEGDPEIKKDIKERLEKAKETIDKLKESEEDLEKTAEAKKADFMRFALEFIDNLGSNFVHLSPNNAEKCKQIIFPDGFWVDDDKNVYTHAISPIYGYRNQKIRQLLSNFPYGASEGSRNPIPSLENLYTNRCTTLARFTGVGYRDRTVYGIRFVAF